MSFNLSDMIELVSGDLVRAPGARHVILHLPQAAEALLIKEGYSPRLAHHSGLIDWGIVMDTYHVYTHRLQR